MSDFIIRSLKLNDNPEWLADLRSLHARCFPYDDMPNFLHDIWWGVMIKGSTKRHLVGCAGMSEKGQMVSCCVLPEHRGHGLQRRLLARREDYARRVLKLKAVTTYTISNPHSERNLIKRRYINIGQDILGEKPPFRVETIWRKKL